MSHHINKNQMSKKYVDESVFSCENDLEDTILIDEDKQNTITSIKSFAINGSNNIFTQKFSIADILS